jgi:hypothetical protein
MIGRSRAPMLCDPGRHWPDLGQLQMLARTTTSTVLVATHQPAESTAGTSTWIDRLATGSMTTPER